MRAKFSSGDVLPLLFTAIVLAYVFASNVNSAALIPTLCVLVAINFSLIRRVFAGMARHQVGSLRVDLDQSGVDAGETITGSVVLRARRPTTGTLSIYFVGYRMERSTRGSNSYQAVEIDRELVAQAGPVAFTGDEQIFDFSKQTPHPEPHGPGTGNVAVFDVLPAAVKFLFKDPTDKLRWRFEARANLGEDELVDEQAVEIHNLKYVMSEDEMSRRFLEAGGDLAQLEAIGWVQPSS